MTREQIDLLRSRRDSSYHPGWGGPEYTTWEDEQLSWKTSCYIGDWSFLWDLRLDGPAAIEVMRANAINNFDKFDVGQAKHLVYTNKDGAVLTDGVVMRLGEESWAMQGNVAHWTSWLLREDDRGIRLSKDPEFTFQISGPTALSTVEAAAGESLRDIKFMRFRDIEIAGVRVQALRMGMAGEPGFELHGPRSETDHVAEAILKAGADHGIRRLGRRTAMINHLEAAFPTGNWHFLVASAEVPGFLDWLSGEYDRYGLVTGLRGSFEGERIEDYYQTPVTLGWTKSIDFSKEFPGREALRRQLDAPDTPVRVTLEFDPADVQKVYASLFGPPEKRMDQIDLPQPQKWGVWADSVRSPIDEHIGISTVPGYSIYFGRVLALAFLHPRYAQPGTTVDILWGTPGTPQTLIKATVAPAPYKTDRRRDDWSSSTTSTPR